MYLDFFCIFGTLCYDISTEDICYVCAIFIAFFLCWEGTGMKGWEEGAENVIIEVAQYCFFQSYINDNVPNYL